MRLCYLLLCFVISMGVYSASQVGEGTFYSLREDNQILVKKVLIHEALRGILTKELHRMGFDTSRFWSAYDQKFEDFFAPILEKTKTKFKVNMPEQTESQKEAYPKKIRELRFSKMIRYFKLLKLMSRWSIISRMKSSAVNPALKTLSIKGRPHRKKLLRRYRSIMNTFSHEKFDKLFISSNMVLEGINFADIGAANKETFEQSLLNSWQEWFSSNFKHRVNEFSVAAAAEKTGLDRYLLIAEKGVKGFGNSLWVTLNGTIKKTYQEDIINRIGFAYELQLIMYDLKTKQIIKSMEWKVARADYTNNAGLASELANSLYRLPVEKVKELKRVLRYQWPNMSTQTVLVSTTTSVNEIFDIIELLNEKGIRFDLSANLSAMEVGGGKIKIDYAGEKSTFDAFLIGLSGSVLGKRAREIQVKKVDELYLFSVVNSLPKTGE